ncbi:DELLA protein RGL2-like [Cornus florida]|uniref:DELLA protein RGL2-like n=1 Tax=Cornus florida TaxID=4283 RepID=UPI00289C54E6|nr:DELLA protein RGL2-like [Cornus florida]
MTSFEQFDLFGVLNNYSPSKSSNSKEGGNFVTEDCAESRDSNSFSATSGVYKEDTIEDGLTSSQHQQEHQLQLCSDFGFLEDLYFDILSPFQPSQEEIEKLISLQTDNSEHVDPQKEMPQPFQLDSLGILKNYGSGFRRLNREKINIPNCDTRCTKLGGKKLSTEAILRQAAENFIQSPSQRIVGSSLFGLSAEETRDVQLVQFLLASAEKAGQQQFNRALKLLNKCNESSSDTGSPVQRVVFYFAEALREKIDREAGRITPKRLVSVDIEEAMMSLNSATLACHETLPFCQIGQFTGMQAILDNITQAKKIHLIDIEIRNGVQCTVLMQALAARHECPVELLKITAVGTKSKPKLEETGKQLVSFAQTLNLPFSFNIVMVSDMLDLNENLFELEAEEVVAVYAQYCLRTLIPKPDQLECLMRVVRNINPCVMVVAEVEGNHNSPVFVDRFIETLFYFSAYFDCLGDCMDQKDQDRMITESMYFSYGIRNIVAAEGKERNIRHVKINVWRAFFVRFGIIETELSTSSLYQAKLVVKNLNCGNSCTLDMDGKCLIMGWKGTPLSSISAWKFL